MIDIDREIKGLIPFISETSAIVADIYNKRWQMEAFLGRWKAWQEREKASKVISRLRGRKTGSQSKELKLLLLPSQPKMKLPSEPPSATTFLGVLVGSLPSIPEDSGVIWKEESLTLR